MRSQSKECDTEELMRKLLSATPTQKKQIWDVLTNPKPIVVEATAKQNTKLYSITAAAKLLAISRNSLYSLIRQRRLVVIQIAGAPKITGQSIDELLAGERPPNEITKEMVAESKSRYKATKERAA